MKIDKDRILTKLNELDSYLYELSQVKPQNLNEYKSSILIKRSCERLLQIAIECVIDICNIIIKELRLGVPSDEDDIFEKLYNVGVISSNLVNILRGMKGFRNVLVHKYGVVNDELVFEFLRDRIEDFETFKREIIKFLERSNS
ncbi:MAG: type VII toxin-antitoxin system HepT family RNase toxin [Candidatus Asgardarchaeia archaeon]